MPAAPPKVMHIAKGYSYLSEIHLDEVEPIVSEIRSHILERDGSSLNRLRIPKSEGF
jgi:hypothetical protein